VQIPLALRCPGPGRLVYAIPVWYRVVMGFILAIFLAGFVVGGAHPGFLTWAVLAIVLLAGLYEETWIFDADQDRVIHRAGLVIAARSSAIDLAAIERFLIVPHVEGTIPGSEEERRDNATALRGSRSDDASEKRSRHKKPFLSLVLACADGTDYPVDRVPARNAAHHRELWARMAALCGKPLVDFQP